MARMFISLILNPFRGLPGPSADRHSSGNRDLSWPFARYRHSSFRCCSTSDKALAYLREGDVLVITRLSRAMRSLKHLLALADELRGRGVGLVVLKQQIDTTTPTGRLVFHVLGAIDEFQRELIIEGTREGLAAARARGRTGGRKPKLNDRQAATVRRMYAATGPDGKRQHTVAEIAEAVGVHRTTVYDYLKKED